MAIELTENGLLPDGIHDTDFTTIERLFGGFQKSTRRMQLVSKLREYVEALRRAEIGGWLIVDGSFVMSCIDEPDDIDVVLVLASDWDVTKDLRPFQYNLVSRRDVKRSFPIDVFTAIVGTEAEQKWMEFFHQINIKWYQAHGFVNGARKGLVRIAL